MILLDNIILQLNVISRLKNFKQFVDLLINNMVKIVNKTWIFQVSIRAKSKSAQGELDFGIE